jgi:hypothetical protein
VNMTIQSIGPDALYRKRCPDCLVGEGERHQGWCGGMHTHRIDKTQPDPRVIVGVDYAAMEVRALAAMTEREMTRAMERYSPSAVAEAPAYKHVSTIKSQTPWNAARARQRGR